MWARPSPTYKRVGPLSAQRGWADGFCGVTGRNGGRSRSWGKEEGFCRGVREEKTVAVSGVEDSRIVVGMYTYGVAGGGEAVCGFFWWLERQREGERNYRNGAVGGWFFVNFGPDFLLPQIINGASIYRRWKRVIPLSRGKISAIDSVGKDLNRWLKCALWVVQSA